MPETSLTLLDRLQRGGDAGGWELLVEIYSPLVRGWLRRYDVDGAEADDVLQEVLTVVVRKLPGFERGPHQGSFRSWLRAITVNCIRGHWRTSRREPAATGDSRMHAMLAALEDPESELSKLWDADHDRFVTHYLLEQIRGEFADATWQAFRQVVLESRSPDEVAAALGITVNAVFIAKSRILRRLRERGAGLLDGE